MIRLWKRWLKLAEILGNIQMTVLLTVVYWLMLFPLAIPFKILSDPLGLKKSRPVGWTKVSSPENILESMRKQG